MRLNVSIPASEIATRVENVITTERIVNKPYANNSIAIPNSFKGFAMKAIEFILNFTKPVGNFQEVLVGDKNIFYITLKNAKESAVFFETFKKLGINIGVFTMGFDTSFNKLYLSDKLIKDLKRYDGTSTLSAIVMYLISLGHFFSCMYTANDKFIVDTYLAQVTIDDSFANYFYPFKNEDYYVELQGIASEDYEKISWVRSPYSTYEYTSCSCNILNYNFIEVDGDKQALVYKFALGARPMYFQIFENGDVITNNELSYFELQSDSMTRLIMPRTVDAATIESKHLIGSNWRTLEVDEVSDTLKAILADTMTRTECAEGLSKEDATNLGISIKGSSIALDADSMKAQYAEDEYAQQLYEQALPYYDDFELGNLVNLTPGFSKGDVYALWFTGDAGTGKSTSARVIPYRCGIPYVSVNFSVNVEESDLFGSMIPNPTKKEASDPEFIWQDGIITKAVRNGYCVILEEINFARPGVLGKFNSLLDENRQIDLVTGEIVKAHKNFRIIATSNIAYEGTNRMNKAFINRFEQIINFQTPDMAALTEIIKSRTGYKNDSNIAGILDAYYAIKKYSDEQNLDVVISIRQLLTIFKQGKYYKTALEAVENIMVNGAFIDVPEHAEMFKKSILPALNLKFKI